MKQAKSLTERDIKTVLTYCSTRRYAQRDRAIVLVSHLAGLRAKEIAALTIGNVLADDLTIREEFTLTPKQTKGSKSRRGPPATVDVGLLSLISPLKELVSVFWLNSLPTLQSAPPNAILT